jgi:cyanophycinase-like exopeptidase
MVADGRGYIIPVGGAEEKIGDITILRRFASLCDTGGRIAIIPTASEMTDTGARYETLFQGLGVTEARRAADPDTLVASAKAYLGALNKIVMKRQRDMPAQAAS